MQINHRWTIDFTRQRKSAMQHDGPTAMVVPQFPIPRGMPAEVAALLPVANYNDRLLGSLNVRPEWSRIDDIATFFAADPFIRVDRFAAALRARGMRRICNVPTCSQLGLEYSTLVADVNLGYGRELSRLADMAGEQFEIYPAVCTMNEALQALELQPAGLVVLRSPATLTDEIGEDLPLKALCQQIRREMGSESERLLLALTGERGSQAIEHVDGTIRYAV